MSDECKASVAEPISEIDRLRKELGNWRNWCVIEVAIRNRNVAEYMEHWEGRALKAEADLAECMAHADAIVAYFMDEAGAPADCVERFRAWRASR